jgi:signal transduction histidine kinase
MEHRFAAPGGEEVDIDLGPAGAVPTRAAPDPFRVILENLLDNARKYGGDRPVRLRARVEGDRVALEVVDGGVGFRDTDADAIFEPYQRGSNMEGRHGTGLGLYIARTLARSLEGDLRAASLGEGRGATFTLWLARG